MMKKKVTFEIIPVDKRYRSVFLLDSISGHYNIIEIPISITSKIEVTYYNGMVVELSGDELEKPLPVSNDNSKEISMLIDKEVKYIKVFIDVEKFENMINKRITDLFNENFK